MLVTEGQILHDSSYDVSNIVKLIDPESKVMVAGTRERGQWELLFKMCKLSVMKDE